MQFTLITLLTICCLLFSGGLYAQVRDGVIFVHTDDQADFRYLSDASNRPSSLSADINKALLNAQPITINYEYTPLKRSLKLMEKRANICILDKIKTPEREANYDFSNATNMFLSRRLYQQSSLPPLNQSPVNLPELFYAQPKHRILLTEQVNYGAVIEKQLLEIDIDQKVMRSASEHAMGLLDMFQNKRAEYALFYPQQLQELGIELTARTYDIDGQAPFIMGHIMCTKKQLTGQLLLAVNQSLKIWLENGVLLQRHLVFTQPKDKAKYVALFAQAFSIVK